MKQQWKATNELNRVDLSVICTCRWGSLSYRALFEALAITPWLFWLTAKKKQKLVGISSMWMLVFMNCSLFLIPTWVNLNQPHQNLMPIFTCIYSSWWLYEKCEVALFRWYVRWIQIDCIKLQSILTMEKCSETDIRTDPKEFALSFLFLSVISFLIDSKFSSLVYWNSFGKLCFEN